ncbi:MAG: DNA alkylation repair protein, partial [Treponema sp.]|nr:DNA alkylation repair protein [Treponema sp.]
MKTNKIQEQLFSLQDTQYATFTARIIPTVDRDSIIGIRTPALRAFAKELVRKEDKAAAPEEFLNGLPHKYFEENQLHA